MREIKFRAYGHPRPFTIDELVMDDSLAHYLKNQAPALMQYTGLKDKNGMEIYEGDILGKRPYGYLKSDGTKDGRYKGKEWECFAVEWVHSDASEAGLVSGYEYETDGKFAGWNITFGGLEFEDDTKQYEVIGNIYENPELLK